MSLQSERLEFPGSEGELPEIMHGIGGERDLAKREPRHISLVNAAWAISADEDRVGRSWVAGDGDAS
ncbi:MAG: hypothetical protein M3017_14225 [Actinomycetota bacterium]|nr:hypothetical protein [Actinomycetota bacterium]